MFVRQVGIYDKDGETIGEYPTVTAAAEAVGMGTTALINRIKGYTKDKQGRTFRYLTETMVAAPRKPSSLPKTCKAVTDGKCVEIPFEIKYGAVCVTVCKHRPERKVGSAACKACYNHGGMERERSVVYCKNKGRKSSEKGI